ncbi:hypothetical protein LCGC14_2445030 [marine sediment metagenome]|uniref:Uncharacterized protein n=1 Tax=marine sediment metagenome TaxID=412755 RepID=A0A0F9EBQ4_9ZZZZ
MKDDIRNLDTLVNLVAGRVVREVKEGSDKSLKELLWNVPTNILANYARDADDGQPLYRFLPLTHWYQRRREALMVLSWGLGMLALGFILGGGV